MDPSPQNALLPSRFLDSPSHLGFSYYVYLFDRAPWFSRYSPLFLLPASQLIIFKRLSSLCFFTPSLFCIPPQYALAPTFCFLPHSFLPFHFLLARFSDGQHSFRLFRAHYTLCGLTVCTTQMEGTNVFCSTQYRAWRCLFCQADAVLVCDRDIVQGE